MTRSKMISALAKQLDIVVTAERIADAIPKDSSHCMISEAVKDSLPTAKNISTDLATIRFTDPSVGRRYIYLTPPTAQRALLRFDQGLPVEPFHFRLKSAAQIIKAGTSKSGEDRKRRPVKSMGNGSVPVLQEGTPLPRGPLAKGGGPNYRGRIRAFGLRQLTP